MILGVSVSACVCIRIDVILGVSVSAGWCACVYVAIALSYWTLCVCGGGVCLCFAKGT